MPIFRASNVCIIKLAQLNRTTMKKTLFIALCLIQSLVYSQEKQSPTYYLNAAKYLSLDNIYINPKNIAAVNIKKETPAGEIYIKTNNGQLNLLTIPDILKKHSVIISNNNLAIYLINGELISDASKVRVDDTYFIDVNTQSLANATKLKKKFRKLVVITITLSQEDIKPRVMIRGNDIVKARDLY
ncbi:hypothetical protein CYCD_24180 [Tenuifilaceae bacterium CYCD]|nr:hypothetical protein CYCD_24180 [Tenuifilaceae bacterium CYCD]